MARITVEDCIIRVPNRFELIMLAAQRARELSKGVPTTVEVENDKSHVIALREIAEGTIDPAAISEAMLDALSGIDHDDAVMDEPEDRLFEMEAPSAKFDFDQAIRDWEREGEDEDSKEGAADADPANWEQGNPEGIARQPRLNGDLSDDAMDAANEDDGGSTLAEQA